MFVRITTKTGRSRQAEKFDSDSSVDVQTVNRRGSFQITLRPAKEISEIDLKSLENPTRPANQGIYKFDGDTLTMCTNPRPVAARPKGFASVIGTGDILEVYEKIK